jgi:hypothetical protein
LRRRRLRAAFIRAFGSRRHARLRPFAFFVRLREVVMHPHDVDAILRAEGSAPIPFAYQKGDYALQLLLLTIGGGRPIGALRQSRFGRLLEKPELRPVLARAPGILKPSHLLAALAAERESFSLTLERWGSPVCRYRSYHSPYHQTSRPGHNLVVQLNFPRVHDRAYRALVEPTGEHPFMFTDHPARDSEPFTLAWVRLDVDTEAGEVLIEEVQCDWVRNSRYFGEAAAGWLEAGEPASLAFESELGGTAPRVLSYLERTLAPYAALWAECALAAALAFVYERLALRRVFFHTYDSGRLMKGLRSAPPRSLYTDLPRQFCFLETDEPPRAFRRDKRVRERAPRWFELALV